MVVTESYSKLGLERRIRRYERVRDVLNSWDRDTQNALVLQHSDTKDVDLQATNVPEVPTSATAYMYHSTKTGKWLKKHVTLLSSGQIFTSKKLGAKISDKDTEKICHLSDFDIYSVTPQHSRKIIKPPKKYCYAVKSQQKTTMWQSTDGFVHFFSTDSENAAQEWYSAVQEWRSWYLLHKKGSTELKPSSGVKPQAQGVIGTVTGHKANVSLDEGPYTIGSFKPLLDTSRFEEPATGEVDDDEEDNRPRQIPFHLRNSVHIPLSRSSEQLQLSPPLLGAFPPNSNILPAAVPQRQPSKSPHRMLRERHPPPTTLTRRLPASGYQSPDFVVPMVKGDEAFESGGLLGRSYTQRQKTLKDRGARGEQQQQDGFIPGPSLLNNAGGSGTSPLASGGPQGSGLGRSATVGRRPGTAHHSQSRSLTIGAQKPLLEFNDNVRIPELPHRRQVARGHGVPPPQDGMLITGARSREPDTQEAGGVKASC